jgi:hypothetical protein
MFILLHHRNRKGVSGASGFKVLSTRTKRDVLLMVLVRTAVVLEVVIYFGGEGLLRPLSKNVEGLDVFYVYHELVYVICNPIRRLMQLWILHCHTTTKTK